MTHPVCRMARPGKADTFIIPNENYWRNMYYLERYAELAGVPNDVSWYAPQHVGWQDSDDSMSTLTYGVEKEYKDLHVLNLYRPSWIPEVLWRDFCIKKVKSRA